MTTSPAVHPAVPRPAATAILVRDLPDPSGVRAPLQVFLLRRAGTMAFAAGMTVFPGGGVDAADGPAEAGGFVRAALRETLEECGVLLTADLLHPWARWVTPVQEPRRYDAMFFVAALPAGQAADARTTEAVEARWWYPADALGAHDAGSVRLMPPTWLTLTELAGLGDVASVLAASAGRVVEPIRPTLERRGERTVAVVGDREIAMP